MTVKKYIEENKNLPPALYDMVLDNTHIWAKGACYGYALIALSAIGFNREQISEILHHLHNAMEDYSVPEAVEEWHKF